MMWGYYTGSGMAWWMIVSSLLWLGLAALAVWALVRWVTGPHGSSGSPSTDGQPQQAPALEILKARYARGEIDTPTFQAMRAELEATGAGASQRETTLSSSH